jgi:hypothetical protein
MFIHKALNYLYRSTKVLNDGEVVRFEMQIQQDLPQTRYNK